MRALPAAGIALAFCLGGCHPISDNNATASHQGRYQSAGIYPAGQMWTQLANTGPSKAPNMPKLSDDEQILVMVDSETGEVRQCGNISGYCIGMKPWAGALAQGQMAPLSLLKHADDLAREAEDQAAQHKPSSD